MSAAMTSASSAGIATEVTDANINEFGYNLKGDHNIAGASLCYSSAKWWISYGQFFLMLLTEPVVQQLSRRLVAEGGTLPFLILENLDLFKRGCPDLSCFSK